MVKVLEDLSGIILIVSSGSEPSFYTSVRDSKRILSQASEQFEINSRKKISLLEYNALIIKLSN